MDDRQRRDDATHRNRLLIDPPWYAERAEPDDPRVRGEKGLGQQQLTLREREERWPIG